MKEQVREEEGERQKFIYWYIIYLLFFIIYYLFICDYIILISLFPML
jgi:hypothetical protein